MADVLPLAVCGQVVLLRSFFILFVPCQSFWAFGSLPRPFSFSFILPARSFLCRVAHSLYAPRSAPPSLLLCLPRIFTFFHSCPCCLYVSPPSSLADSAVAVYLPHLMASAIAGGVLLGAWVVLHQGAFLPKNNTLNETWMRTYPIIVRMTHVRHVFFSYVSEHGAR